MLWNFWLMVWREFNVILSLLALALLIARYVEFRHVWNDQERALRWAVMMFCFGTAVGSLMAVVRDSDFNFGMPFVTVASLLVLYAKIKKPKRLTGGR